MKRQRMYRSNWAMPIALLIIFAVAAGCAGQGPVVPQQSSTPVATELAAASPPPEASSPTPAGNESTPAPQPTADESVLSQDIFTNPSTGWDDAKLDTYFVGYHGPEWYHIEIDSPHSKVPISEPSKTKYDNVTVEAQIFAVSAKTDPNGDFRYGLVFRRSGGQYYAFTISPNTKNWQLLKVSPEGVETLKEGVDDSIHDRDTDDLLRVDVAGSSFLLHINDHIAGQVTDATYSSGEVGIYAETIDNPKIHIHFDTFTIRDLQLDLKCSVPAGTVYVRSGPSTTYGQIAVLSSGDTVKALGKSPNQWIQIAVEGSDQPGWVSYRYDGGELSCTPSIDLFPVVTP